MKPKNKIDELDLIEGTKTINFFESREGYVKLYNKHKPFLLHYVGRWVNDEGYKQDVVAETFLKAFSNMKAFKESKASFSTWISTIARNTAIDWLRKGMATPDLFTSETEELTSYLVECFGTRKANIIDVINTRQIKDEINKSIDKDLNEMSKKVFMLYYDGYAYEEISKKINIPLNSVKVYIFRTKKHLQNKFKHLKCELSY